MSSPCCGCMRLWCKISASSKLPAISPPCAPALPTTAPPSVPGMPAAHSSPASPRCAAWRANTPKLTPDSAQTWGGSLRSLKRMPRARFKITRPRTPRIADQDIRAAAQKVKGQPMLPGQADGDRQLVRAVSTSQEPQPARPAGRRYKRASGTSWWRLSPKRSCIRSRSSVEIGPGRNHPGVPIICLRFL